MSAIVVMGVTGCGKSTAGTLLAARLELPFVEADDVHPAANRAKMAAGVPLTDADRAPWLAALAERIATARSGRGVVVSCSALKRTYRDVLRGGDPRLLFLHLVITPAEASARVNARRGHYMPATLVASQFEALEPLGPDERGIAVDASLAPELIVAAVGPELSDGQHHGFGPVQVQPLQAFPTMPELEV